MNMHGDNDQYDDRGSGEGLSPLVIAAHELKSPLALIRQLSFELIETTSDTEKIDIAEEIRVVSERALRLSSNITKAESLQQNLFESTAIKPQQICEEVKRELSPLYKVSGKTLKITMNSKIPLVVANYDLLRRILLGFGDNALHYSDDHGAVTLFMQLIGEKNQVRIGVRDHGPTVPRALVKKLFSGSSLQPVSTRPESSGIGLLIASEFSRAIGGTIGAIRHQNGASFYVDVPVSRQMALL